MKTIHKYCLGSVSELKTLNLKEGFKIVRAEYVVVNKSVYMWVEEALKPEVPELSHEFKVVMSGDPVPDDYVYRATALDQFGPEAFHVFEVPAEVSRGSSSDDNAGRAKPFTLHAA